jgi:glycosyltransferase involved in cell wall biosynthesis
MRIGIDARELAGQPTGVGRYLAGLLREWNDPGARHDHEIVLYSHRPLDGAAGGNVRILKGAGGTAWEQLTLARAVAHDRADLLFSPAYSTPLVTRVPRVVALHDVSFAARPEWFSPREGFRRRFLARRAVAAAAAVVTISTFSKSEIVRLFGAPPSRVHVIPPGVDAPCPPGSDHPRESIVLYVGSIFARRRIPDLVAAFNRLATRRADVTLHLVGDNRSHPPEDIAGLIAASAGAARIRWYRYAPEHELRQLYARARAFAFLSEYEGLGLTPLEALTAGVPSVLLDTPVAREACGDSALYVPAGDTEGTAAALERLLYDPDTRSQLLGAAPAVLARYDWRAAARDTLALLETAA